MGKLTQGQIRQLKEPGRYSDGDGLFLELNRPGKGNWHENGGAKLVHGSGGLVLLRAV